MTAEEFLKKKGCYAWSDGTIDVLVDTADFHSYMSDACCALCGTQFDISMKTFGPQIYGMKIACPECGQAWFIHSK